MLYDLKNHSLASRGGILVDGLTWRYDSVLPSPFVDTVEDNQTQQKNQSDEHKSGQD